MQFSFFLGGLVMKGALSVSLFWFWLSPLWGGGEGERVEFGRYVGLKALN